MICDPEALEELAAGRLDGARARALAAHAGECDACRRELAWLRAERELIARRAANSPSVQKLWRGIERRLEAEPRRSAFARSALPIMMAAAAAVAVILWSRWRPALVAPSAMSTSARVEHQLATRGYDREYAASLSSVVIQLEPPP